MDTGAESYRKFLQGDESGLDEIIIAYRNGLILYINSIVKDVTLAEDTAEETFVKLFAKRPRYTGDASFKTFLYTIGRNTAIDAMRRRVTHTSIDECEEIPSPGEGIEEILIREEREAALLREIANLKPEQSQALWLVYYEGMSTKEAAAVMKKSVHATEQLLYRARQELKAKLTEGGFDA